MSCPCNLLLFGRLKLNAFGQTLPFKNFFVEFDKMYLHIFLCYLTVNSTDNSQYHSFGGRLEPRYIFGARPLDQ